LGYPAGEKLFLERLWRESLDLGIMAIDFADGLVLQSVAHVVASTGGTVFIDAGAGIGFSTYWIARGVASGCTGSCTVAAIEYVGERLERLRENASLFSKAMNVSVNPVGGDALEYVSSLDPGSIDFIFVDIEKESYPRMTKLLETRLARGRIAVFHNAFHPRPPSEFFDQLSRGPWIAGIIPTSAGIVVATRK